MTASLGYTDPRGLPVWEKTQINQVRKTEIGDNSAKVVVEVVTTYADRPDEPSLEDDIIYLTLDGRTWLIAKASSTLYRAVGIGDVPVTVLSPPD